MHKLLAIALLLAAPARGGVPTPCSDAPAGLVGCWAGNGDATDAVGGNDGTPMNGAGFDAGLFGQAFSFDGVNDWVQTASPTGITGASPRTLCAFVQAAVVPTDCCATPVSFGGPSTGHGFGSFVSSMSWWFWGYFADINSNVAVDTEWHHHCISYDGTKVVYWLDGVPIVDQALTLDTSSSPLVIGDGFDHRSDTPFEGRVDEVQLYDRALPEQEVVALCELAGNPCGSRLDAFLCYKTGFKHDVQVSLAGDWGTGAYTGKKASLVCTPSDAGEEIFDPKTHLAAWAIQGPKDMPVEVEVTSSLGTFRLVASKTSTLRVPTAVSQPPDPPPPAPDPSSHAVDPFHCRKVKRAKGADPFPKGVDLTVSDAFGSRSLLLKKPVAVCVPTDKNEEGIERPDAGLLCLKAKPSPRTKVEGAQWSNQLAEATSDLAKEVELCLPASVTVAGAPASRSPDGPAKPSR